MPTGIATSLLLLAIALALAGAAIWAVALTGVCGIVWESFAAYAETS